LHAPRLLFWRDERTNTVRAYDPFAGAFAGKPVPLHSRFGFLAGLSLDGNVLLVSEGAFGKPSKRALLWDLRTGKQATPPLAPTFTWANASASFYLSPDGKAVLAKVWQSPSFNQGGRGETSLTLYDATTGKRRWGPLRVGPDSFNYFVFSSDGKILVGGAPTHPVAIVQSWEAATGKPLRRYPLPPNSSPDTAMGRVVISPDGRTLAVALDSWSPPGGPGRPAHGGTPTEKGKARFGVQLWDMASGEPLGGPLPFRRPVKEIVFSPDSKTFLTCTAPLDPRGLPESPKGQAQLWKVPERSSGKTDSSPGKSGTDRKDR